MRFTVKRAQLRTPEDKALAARVRAAHPKVKRAAYMQKLIMVELNRPQREAQQAERRLALEKKIQEELQRKAEAAKLAAIVERERNLAWCNDPAPRHTRATYKAAHKGPLVKPVLLLE